MASQRRRIAAGIWREGDRLFAEARIGSWRDGTQGRKIETFPLGTDPKIMQAWRRGAQQDLLLAAPTVDARGTLAADIPTYLAMLPEGRYKIDSVGIFDHWIACPVGAMPRGAIQRTDVIEQIARWVDAGAAINTCNKRISRLRKMFHTLDGITAPNPTDAVKYSREPEYEPRDIPIRVVKLILESLPDQGRAELGHDRPEISATKIRLRVLAYTGITPATLRRVTLRHLDLARSRIFLTPRRKGKGVPGSWVRLLPPAVDALRDFVAAGLIGKAWSQSSMRHSWQRAIARATKSAAAYAEHTGDRTWVADLENLPPTTRPYDLRHSFASEIYRLTGDIRAVSELLQHADLETTKRYTKGAVSERVTAAITTAAGTYATTKGLPALPAAPAFKLVKKRA